MTACCRRGNFSAWMTLIPGRHAVSGCCAIFGGTRGSVPVSACPLAFGSPSTRTSPRGCGKRWGAIPGGLVDCASDYLSLKETKSSYAIERLTPSQKRTAVFMGVLREAGREELRKALPLRGTTPLRLPKGRRELFAELSGEEIAALEQVVQKPLMTDPPGKE